MEVRALLHRLQLEGLKVELEGDRLSVGPSQRLNDDLRRSIREHKHELIALLSEADDPMGWSRIRTFGSRLGESVSDGARRYQLWGVTPRGAICFDGTVFRTLDFDCLEVGRTP